MNILLTVARIRPGEEEALREILSAIDRDPEHNPFIQFPRSPSTHFARWVIFADPDGSLRLLFCANYDGGIQRYLTELVSAGPGMSELWGKCLEYQSAPRFVDFVRSTFVKPRGVYIGFPKATVDEIRRLMAIREAIERFLDLPDVAAYLETPGVGPFLDTLDELPTTRSLSRMVQGRGSLLGGAWGTIHGVWLRKFLTLARWFAQQGQAQEFPRVRGGCEGQEGPDRQREQDIQTVHLGPESVQNQMTTVTDIIPSRLRRLWLALAGTSILSRFGWAPGEFADVGTLHWFSWGVIDNGRRLLFLSAFDGSWQNYMQDFINKLVWGLDSLYGNTYDYPSAGMKDVVAFTDYILAHQYPPQVFYSAYPSVSVMNLIQDRRLATPLAGRFDREAVEGWCRLL